MASGYLVLLCCLKYIKITKKLKEQSHFKFKTNLINTYYLQKYHFQAFKPSQSLNTWQQLYYMHCCTPLIMYSNYFILWLFSFTNWTYLRYASIYYCSTVSLYTINNDYTRYNIFSTWFLDIVISTCLHWRCFCMG